jgi:esterase/lipase superfamily enzyme
MSYEFTEEKLDAYRLRCQEVATQRSRIISGRDDVRVCIDEEDKIYTEAGEVQITVYARGRYDDDEYYNFPIAYLYNDDWHEELIKELADAKEKKRISDENKERINLGKAERAERIMLASLKAKYEKI